MKKHGVTTRVGAVILAASMIVGDAVPALAAEKASIDETYAAVSEITADEGAADTQIAETEETEETETKDSEEVVDVEDTVLADEKGVSTVIGLEGDTTYYTMSSDDNTVTKKYAYADRANVTMKSSVEIPGAPVAQDANGLYNVNGRCYAYVYYNSVENTTRYSTDVTDYVITTVEPVYNEQTYLFEVNGKFYSSYDTAWKRDAQGNRIEDAAGNDVAGCYYVNPNSEVITTATATITAEKSWLYYSDVEKVVGKKLSESDKDYSYYEIGGKLYNSIYSYHSKSLGNNTYEVAIFGTRGNEISFDKRYQRITWNEVSNETEVGANGKVYYVGYQVEVNGTAAVLEENTVAGETFTTDSYFIAIQPFAVGEQAIYRVRAVYYTETTDATTKATTYAIVATGDWSESYAYTTEGDITLVAVPAVSGVTAALKNNSNTVYDVNWGAVADADSYSVQVLYSDKPIDAAALSEYTWSNKASSYSVWNAETSYELSLSGRTRYYDVETTAEDEDGYSSYKRSYYKYAVCAENDPDRYTYYWQYNPATGKSECVYLKKVACESSDLEAVSYTTDYTQTTYYKEVTADLSYAYIRVAAKVTYDNDKYVGTRSAYSAPVGVQLNEIALDKVANVPAITGLKVENKTDGTFTLKWNRVNDDARIKIFYTKDATAFADGSYLYSTADAYNAETGKYFNNQPEVSERVTLAGKKIKTITLDGDEEEVSSSSFNLEYGKKYYFAVVTYDSALRSEKRATTPYVLNGVSYVNYTDISTPAMTSAVLSLGTIGVPDTKSEKDSITITFGSNKNITGYEIYRKNGKKYAKIATTTSRQYVDSSLKADTTYKYKAVAYNYNPVTKATYKSDAVFFSAETSTNNYIDVKVAYTSKNAVKVSWTKVAGAVKYEVYRTNTDSTDNTLTKANSTGNWYAVLSNSKWTLVKTITKAKTTSLKDKGLTAGETYAYKVVATYKSGKITKQITDSDSITLKMSAPQNVKATLTKGKVKVTWDADKYAKKYEVRYKVYDAQEKAYNDDWTVVTTSKAAYTVPASLKNGEYAEAQVRATDGKKWTSWSSQVSDSMTLAAVKGVKAVNTTVKDAKGVESAAVKVTWKSVSGAAYYSVYRSTSPAVSYNKDEKVYVNYDGVAIAKESNNDENNDTVYYDEYKGKVNTVTGTSAIDRGQLQSGVKYYYFVIAYAENGTAVSYGVSANTSVVFKAVASIKKAAAAKGKVTLTINKTTGAKSYVVYRSEKKNGGYTKIGTTKKTTYVDKKVKKGKTYYYKVAATGTNGLKADFAAESAAVKVKAK